MDIPAFHQVFDPFPAPVLMHLDGKWEPNTSAQAVGLSPSDLEQLESTEDRVPIWLAGTFYQPKHFYYEGQMMVILQRDGFFSVAGSNVASQLREMLQPIFYSVEQLQGGIGPDTDPEVLDSMSSVNRNLYRILRMVIQLEDILEPDRQFIHFSHLDIAAFLRRWAPVPQGFIESAGLQFVLDVQPASLILMADQTKVAKMLLCLLSNSLKYTPSGGKVILTLRQQQDQAVITVADTGPGFSPDVLTHPLWNQPGFLHANRGLGLSLPLAQRIAGAHGGTLVAAPTPSGSKVVITLPVNPTGGVMEQPRPRIESQPGFSLEKIFLSDGLPDVLYRPDTDSE